MSVSAKAFCNECICFSTRNNEYLFHCDSKSCFEKGILENPARLNELEKYHYKKPENYYQNQICTGEDVRHFIYTSGLNQLILSISYACNFRCKYCFYGDAYPESREHQGVLMSFDVAKKAIDDFMQHIVAAKDYNPRRKFSIMFYGGEPLLNFPVLKRCVTYFEEKYAGWNAYFQITTNGYLLTDEIIDFIIAHDIGVSVSFDGPKSEQDRLRITAEGKGTFDVVYSNIQKLYRKRNERVSVLSVYDPKTDLVAVSNFFDKDQFCLPLMMSPVRDTYSTYYDQFTESDYQKYFENVETLRKIFFETCVGSKGTMWRYSSRFFLNSCMRFFEGTTNTGAVNEKLVKLTNGCVPGVKVHVVPDGTYYMCEKMLDKYPIGTIQTGLDFEAMAAIVNDYNEKVAGCIACKFREICAMCEAQLEGPDGFHFNSENCKTIQEGTIDALQLTYEILEKDPTWARAVSANYYREMCEKAGGFYE